MIKNPRWFGRFNSVFHRLRFVTAGSLVLAAAAALSLSTVSTQVSSQFGERHRGSAAFLKHTEDLVAAKIGDLDESPTSWADQNYQLNGGDSITDSDIAGAQAAFQLADIATDYRLHVGIEHRGHGPFILAEHRQHSA